MATRSGTAYLKVEEQLLEVPPMSTPNQTETASQESQLLVAADGSGCSSRPITRKMTDYWLIGHPSASISGSKLPDCRQVMKHFLHLRHDMENIKNKVSNDEISYIVADTVTVFWQMARIKTKTRQNCMIDVLSLWREWDSLMKNKGRPTDPGGKRAKYKLKLDGLFDIGAPDAIDEILKSRLLSKEKKDIDIRFYLDQQTDRMATMNGHDKVFEEKAKVKLVRVRRELFRRGNSNTENAELENDDNDSQDDDNDTPEVTGVAGDNNDTDVDEDFVAADVKRRKRETNQFVKIALPKKIMECIEITTAADRLKLSDKQTTMLVSAIIKAGNGNLDDFDISRSTTRRCRMANRQKLSVDIIESVRQNPPKFGALHWDGKLVTDIVGDSSERLAVLVSGAPEYTEGKLLGVPSLINSTGRSQADASYDLLGAWELQNNIVALVFDTTSSNSGIHNGAAKLLEEQIGQKLLYLACRHHILEIIVSAVWKQLLGQILGPDNKLFSAFKTAWSDLDKEMPVETLSTSNAWLESIRDCVVKDLKTLLSDADGGSFPRDDYRECAENTLLILGEIPPRGVHFLKPGAINQARWMACNIYAGKMFMFSNQLSYDAEMIMKLQRMNIFLSLFYTSRWLKASTGADAPMNDLQFIHDMLEYRSIDREVADIALDKLSNHRWYLTEELVPFALFSNIVPDNMKQNIASKLMSVPEPEHFRLGKPVFRQVNRQTSLVDLIGPESHTLFHALHIAPHWLAKPVSEWPLDSEFTVAETFVRTVKVVNDAAERGVKLISDFASIITCDPEQRAALLQGVEKHRQQYKDFDKKTLNK